MLLHTALSSLWLANPPEPLWVCQPMGQIANNSWPPLAATSIPPIVFATAKSLSFVAHQNTGTA